MKEPSTEQCATASLTLGPFRGHGSNREGEIEVSRLVDMSHKPVRHSVTLEVYDDHGSLLRADLSRMQAVRLSLLLQASVKAIDSESGEPPH